MLRDARAGIAYRYFDGRLSEGAVRIAILRAFGGVSVIASIAFVTRFKITCCRWMGSARTGIDRLMPVTPRSTLRLLASGESSATASAITAWISQSWISLLRWSRFRKFLMTSTARQLACLIAVRISFNLLRSRGSALRTSVCPFSIERDRYQWLTDLVRKGRGQRPYLGSSVEMHDLQ